MVVYNRVSVIGGGITGAIVASSLASRCPELDIHVFDQGRNGVGGRASHRITHHQENDEDFLRWDHGCQFFRADTPQCRSIVNDWIAKGWAQEWKGSFSGEKGSDFFGLPSKPPFFVGVGGMQELVKNIFLANPSIHLHTGKRVTNLRRDSDGWTLLGAGGDAAYHDTPEEVARSAESRVMGDGFRVVVLTDISSSFGEWHRAGAGVPPDFGEAVRKRAGARVPLFSAMLAFEEPLETAVSAGSFNDDVLWFVGRSNHKPGLGCLQKDCWTLVSTPEFALKLIEETPMQDSTTGAFVPQSPEYLLSVPAPQLEAAFRRLLTAGKVGTSKVTNIPATAFLNAQRWGSAMPSHRYLDETSATLKVLANVAYDGGRGSLAPTTKDRDGQSFVVDDSMCLIQAGDMVSCYTPGVESAIISALDAAEYIAEKLLLGEQ